MTRKALVTGGAGLIGSHIVDALLTAGWEVRIFDNLEPQTHKYGKPKWIPEEAEFVQGDMRDRQAVSRALQGVTHIFHEAAYGGYMPDISKYVHVNSFGTAQMLEIIREEKLPIQKIVVASSQAVYSEGAANCSQHGLVFPMTRSLSQLEQGDFLVHCPSCDGSTSISATPEHAPISGENVYAITKVDQERLVLCWGKQVGIPTVALRYSCTYGPRQSLFNPYTGLIAIFSTRLINGLPPVLYEDGEQTRDLCFVEDIARANLLAMESSVLDGLPVNIGSGEATTVRHIAQMVGEALEVDIEPLVRGEYRPGEMRHLKADIRRAAKMGFQPEVDLRTGIKRYIDWIKTQGDIREYFAEAEALLKSKKIVQAVWKP